MVPSLQRDGVRRTWNKGKRWCYIPDGVRLEKQLREDDTFVTVTDIGK